MTTTEGWRRCSACKEWIALDTPYYVCNVSTCNRKRTGMVFCSADCWEVHLPMMNHREAWAVEKRSPKTPEPAEAAAKAPVEAAAKAPVEKKREPRRRIVRPDAPAAKPRGQDLPEEVLIVASRLKAYVQASAGMNTSDRVLGPLSDIVRDVIERAIENARRDGRKTVLDRDVPSKP